MTINQRLRLMQRFRMRRMMTRMDSVEHIIAAGVLLGLAYGMSVRNINRLSHGAREATKEQPYGPILNTKELRA